MIRLQRRENGQYFADSSLHIPDMRRFVQMREIVKICTRSPTVLIEPVFRYRTPKSDRLLVLPYALARLATVAASAVRSAAFNVLASNMVIVIGPTPPGTGVM
jgi:hypothetical protein